MVLQDPAAHQIHPPAEVELQNSRGIRDLHLPTPRGGMGYHACEVGWTFGGGGPLGPAHIADAGRAHLTVAPRLGCNPLDHIVAVATIVDEGTPFTFRLATTTHVVDDEDIPLALEELGLGREE